MIGIVPASPLMADFFTMILLVMTAMLIGAVLGLRFEFMILAPAIVIDSAATLAIGMAHSNSFWSILLSVVLALTALQMGYLGGTVIRALIAGARVHKNLPAITAVTQRATR